MKMKIFLMAIAGVLVILLLTSCETHGNLPSNQNDSFDVQIGETVEITAGLSKGKLQITVASVKTITDGAFLPEKDKFLEQYGRYVSETGELQDGCTFVLVTVNVTSLGAEAKVDLTNNDPYCFRADGIFSLIDLTEKQKKNYYNINMDYYSLFDNINDHPFEFQLMPDESIDFTLGFFVGEKRDGSDRDLSQMRVYMSDDNGKVMIDLNLDGDQSD